MDLNWIVFPAPSVNKKQIDSLPFIYIPKKNKAPTSCMARRSKGTDTIPCIFWPYSDKSVYSDKILLFFHGNAEDVSQPNAFIIQLGIFLKLNILMIEYPGYSAYPGSPSSKQIEEDADSVFFYLTQNGINPSDIYIFGRSIGSGPACYLASKYNVGFLGLMSAYTSLRDVACDLVGKFWSKLLKERFPNG